MRLVRRRLAAIVVTIFAAQLVVSQAHAQPAPPDPPVANEERVTTEEVTDPNEALTIAERGAQLQRQNNPSARAAADPCINDRFNSCKVYRAGVEQVVQRTPTSPEETIGIWTVYITLKTRSQNRNLQSTVSYTSEVLATYGVPIAGTFILTVGAQPPAPSTTGTPVGTSEFPLDFGGSGGDQWGFFSPQTTVRGGWSTLQFDTTSVTPVPRREFDPTTLTGQRIRCDGAREVNYGTGCVNPSAIPTAIYPQSAYPNIVPNIRNGQTNSGYGVPASGNPLNRGPSTDNRENRDAACGSSQAARLRNIGGPPPADMTNPSCDEYPFASTIQGGDGATVTWVPLAENTAQGLLMAKFYRESRVMVGDAFYVQA